MTIETDKAIEAAVGVAKAYSDLAQSVSSALLDATAAQQKAQHENMIETAKQCASDLKND
ncbi:hypothetical protein [uncultured Tateyamaria sp.]|uniref:hypothetical protein n=1 Tax=uncultured Tateyamaria sp. TaxID=455651 RepID=UPI00262D30A1|nr:hypothetical protein [uncultured Tateyamaria sp.]